MSQGLEEKGREDEVDIEGNRHKKRRIQQDRTCQWLVGWVLLNNAHSAGLWTAVMYVC